MTDYPIKIVGQGMKQLGILAEADQSYTRAVRVKLGE